MIVGIIQQTLKGGNLMPGYLFHLAFGEEVLKKGGIKDKEAFKLGNIAPDLAPNKMLSHFKSSSIGTFIVPNIKSFIDSYSTELLENDFMKGYLAHIYLDYYFIKNFVSKYIVTLDKKMQPTSNPNLVKFIKLLKNNKYIDLEEKPAEPIEVDSFFRERILHREYSSLNNYLRNDYILSLPQAINIPNYISELPPEAVIANYPELNKELTEILLSSDKTSSIFSYEDYKEFAKNLANKFTNCLKNLS